MQAPWEYGSQFHWLRFQAARTQSALPWTARSVRLNCGRDALGALIHHLRPSRLWLPSYLCQELVAPLLGSGVELRCYPDSPLELSLDLQGIPLRPRDAVLVVNYFGLASRARVLPTDVQGVTVVEDHTHGPCSTWALSSQADYCFASLRKSLPIPDGAVLWSPKDHDLPRPVPFGPHRSSSVQQRLSGMLMKSLYLTGHRVSKSSFRQLLDESEGQIARGSISAMSPLSSSVLDVFPFEPWRSIRHDNFVRLVDALRSSCSFEVLEPADPQESPFVVPCVFQDAEGCTAARGALVARDVYPSCLWPLEEPVLAGVPREHISLACRMFTLPCDGRYGPNDIDRVLEVFAETGLI